MGWGDFVESQMNNSIPKKNLTIWILPIIFLVIQNLPEYIGLGIVGALFLLLIFLKVSRKVTLLLMLSICGYFSWSFLSPLILVFVDNPMIEPTMARFALVGYITIFAVWNLFAKVETSYLSIGRAKEIIRFPLIWQGRKEPIWRFILIFCCICMFPLCFGIFSRKPTLALLGYGVLFATVNSLLEEIVWRGLILPRAVSLVGEKQALIITALSFGMYHISFGFPIWACLIFSVGGIYMGGTSIMSKGLLAPFVMHLFVNMIFVVFGMII